MKKAVTIWEAAAFALEGLGGSGTLNDVFEYIIQNRLYDFGTQNPLDAPHVLDTEMKRKSTNSNRSDTRNGNLFEITDNVYRLLKQEQVLMNTKKNPGSKRIHRAKDKEEIIAELMSEKVGIFKEIWRLLMFSAQVGLQEKKRETLKNIDTGKGIDQSTFGNSPAWPGVCYLMALVEDNTSDVLSGKPEAEDLRLSIFQEYANGGLAILQDYFRDRKIDLDGFLSFIDENTRRSSPGVDLDLSI